VDDITLIPASPAERPILENLMHLYLYDFTEYTGEDADEQGRFTDEHLPKYWVEPNRYPFLVKVNDHPAGFALVRAVPDPISGKLTYHMAEFFIMRKYRRRKIGRHVAFSIFDRFPGHWHVEQEEKNLPAQSFWRKIIGEYTGGRFEEFRQAPHHHPYQVFDAPARKSE